MLSDSFYPFFRKEVLICKFWTGYSQNCSFSSCVRVEIRQLLVYVNVKLEREIWKELKSEQQLFFFFSKKHLFERKRERVTNRKRGRKLPFTDSLPKSLQWLGLDLAEAWSWKFSWGLPHRCQEPYYLSHLWWLPGVALAGSWDQELEPWFEPRYSEMGCRHLD